MSVCGQFSDNEERPKINQKADYLNMHIRTLTKLEYFVLQKRHNTTFIIDLNLTFTIESYITIYFGILHVTTSIRDDPNQPQVEFRIFFWKF